MKMKFENKVANETDSFISDRYFQVYSHFSHTTTLFSNLPSYQTDRERPDTTLYLDCIIIITNLSYFFSMFEFLPTLT